MNLTSREKIVLEAIVSHFVETAEPVSSKLLSEHSILNLSSASIRTIMVNLEQKYLIRQPHTSAGRIPTTLGYRIYVDHLMQKAKLSNSEQELIFRSLKNEGLRMENLLEVSARLLANISHQLTILISPVLNKSIFEKIDIVPISSNKVILVLSIKTGFIKTINVEINEKVNERDIRELTSKLNERLNGLTIEVIKEQYKNILKGVPIDKYGIVKLFLRNPELIFHFDQDQDILFKGAPNLLQNPEFQSTEKVSSILNLIEDKNPLLQLIGNTTSPLTSTSVSIGEEIPMVSMQECSIVTSKYLMGNLDGSISVIGPMRMNYSKLLAIVEYTASAITSLYKKN